MAKAKPLATLTMQCDNCGEQFEIAVKGEMDSKPLRAHHPIVKVSVLDPKDLSRQVIAHQAAGCEFPHFRQVADTDGPAA